MGKPIPPRLRKATLAICGTLSVVGFYGSCQARGAGFRGEGGLEAHHKPLRPEGNGFVWRPPVLGCGPKDFNKGSESMGGVSVGVLDHFNIRTRNLAETVRF